MTSATSLLTVVVTSSHTKDPWSLVSGRASPLLLSAWQSWVVHFILLTQDKTKSKPGSGSSRSPCSWPKMWTAQPALACFLFVLMTSVPDYKLHSFKRRVEMSISWPRMSYSLVLRGVSAVHEKGADLPAWAREILETTLPLPSQILWHWVKDWSSE